LSKVDVLYFSAYPDWLPQSKKRHIQYVKAISAFGVKPVLGKFKSKDKRCPTCECKWNGHEEKETDVNTVLAMLNFVAVIFLCESLQIFGQIDRTFCF
jgi:hypothetical protein